MYINFDFEFIFYLGGISGVGVCDSPPSSGIFSYAGKFNSKEAFFILNGIWGDSFSAIKEEGLSLLTFTNLATANPPLVSSLLLAPLTSLLA